MTTIEIPVELQREGAELIDAARQLLPSVEVLAQRVCEWKEALERPYGDAVPDELGDLPVTQELATVLCEMFVDMSFAIDEPVGLQTPAWARPIEARKQERFQRFVDGRQS